MRMKLVKKKKPNGLSSGGRTQQTFHIFIFYEYIIYQLIVTVYIYTERKEIG